MAIAWIAAATMRRDSVVGQIALVAARPTEFQPVLAPLEQQLFVGFGPGHPQPGQGLDQLAGQLEAHQNVPIASMMSSTLPVLSCSTLAYSPLI